MEEQGNDDRTRILTPEEQSRRVDWLTHELDTIREIFDRMRALPPDGRVRVFTYVQAALSELP